jgi:hypothetical protein
MAIRKNKNGNGANSLLKQIEKVKEGNEEQDNSNLDTLVGKSNAESTENTNNIVQKQNSGNMVNDKKNLTEIKIEETNKQTKKQKVNELVHPEVEDFSMKRSYALKPSTYLKLQELKVFDLAKIKLEYAALNYNDIVDMAICQFHDNIKAKIAKKENSK